MMEILAACQARTTKVQEKEESTAAKVHEKAQPSNVKSEDARKIANTIPTKKQGKTKKDVPDQETIRKKGEMLRLKALQLQMSRDAEEMAAVLAITQASNKEKAFEAGENLMQGAASDIDADSSIEDSSSLLTVLNSFNSIGNADDVYTKRKKGNDKGEVRSMSPAERRKSIEVEKARRKKAEGLRIKKIKLQGEREAEEMMEILAACQARTVQEKQATSVSNNGEQLQASEGEHGTKSAITISTPKQTQVETSAMKAETPSKMNRKQTQEKQKKDLAEQEAIRKKGEMLHLKTLQLQMSRDAEEMAAVLAITQARNKEKTLEAEDTSKQGAASDNEANSSLEDSSTLLTGLSSFEAVQKHDDIETKSNVGTGKKAIRRLSLSEQKKSIEEEKKKSKKLEDIRIKALKLHGEREAEEMMAIFAKLKKETAAIEVSERVQVSEAGVESNSEKPPPTSSHNQVEIPAKKTETLGKKMNREQMQEKKKKELAEQEAIRKKGAILRLKTLQLQMSRDAEEMAAVLAITEALHKERAIEEEHKAEQINHNPNSGVDQAAAVTSLVAKTLLADSREELSRFDEEECPLQVQSPSRSSKPTGLSDSKSTPGAEAISADTLLVPYIELEVGPLRNISLDLPRGDIDEEDEQEAAAIKLQALARGDAAKKALAANQSMPKSHTVVSFKREKYTKDDSETSDGSTLGVSEFVRCVAFPALPRLKPLSTAVLQPMLANSPQGSRASSPLGGMQEHARLTTSNSASSISRSGSRVGARKPPSAAGMAAHARKHLGLQWQAFEFLRGAANQARRKLAHANLVTMAMYALNGGMASSLQGDAVMRRVAAKTWLKEAVERARPVQAQCRIATSDLALRLGVARRARTLVRLSRAHGAQFAALREKSKADDAHYKAGWHAANKTALLATARPEPNMESNSLSTAALKETSPSELVLYETSRHSDEVRNGEGNNSGPSSSRSLMYDEKAENTGAAVSIQSPLENALGVKEQPSVSPTPVSPTRPPRSASKRALKEAQTTALFNARAAIWESELANIFQLLLPEAGSTAVLGPLEVGWLCQVSRLLRAAADANDQLGALQGSSELRAPSSGNLFPPPPPPPPLQLQPQPRSCSLVISVAFLAQPPSKLASEARAAVVETANSVLLGNDYSTNTAAITLVLDNIRPHFQCGALRLHQSS